MKAKQAYKEILDLINKHKDLVNFDIYSLESISKCHILGLEMVEKYGFDIDPKRISSTDWYDMGNHMYLTRMGEKHGRAISWSDNHKQPKDELLLEISFPTGAYIFGDDYPTELFETFFTELKTYEPKYTDTHNHNLYFTLDKAGRLFNEHKDIMSKYWEINKADMNARRIKRMKEEIEKLEAL